MKTHKLQFVLVLFLSVILFFSCEENTDNLVKQDYYEISDSLNRLIMEDAFHLTLNILYENELYNDNIELPEELYSSIYNGLLTLYKADDPVLDTILRINTIHCNPSPDSKSLLFYTDSTAEWADIWFQDSIITATNNTELDSLLETIHAEFWLARKMTSLGGGYEIIITFPDYWNLYALQNAFAKIEGLYYVSLCTYVIHSPTLSDIEIIKDAEGMYLTFILKTNCGFLGGCENEYSWEVFVSEKTGEYEILK